MEYSNEAQDFFQLFKTIRNEISTENGYNLENAIKLTFDKFDIHNIEKNSKLENLNKININSKEGRYLIAALAVITTESQKDKTPEEVLEKLYILQVDIFKYITLDLLKNN